jgi:hypothetical protein
MNRTEYIDGLLDGYLSNAKRIAVSALVHSLEPDEACEYLDLTFEQNYLVRRYLLRKIALDISINFTNDHKKLLSNLRAKLNERKFPRKESCSFCLDFLYDSLPARERSKILVTFLSSHGIRNRNRAYKKIRSNWNKHHQQKIEDNWNNFKDSYCLGIIIDYFPPEYLFDNFLVLTKYCLPYQRSKLFLKLGNKDSQLINVIRDTDQISYSYILVKLNKKVTEMEAQQFLNNNCNDDRIGLLIWSFGQMGLWNVIVNYVQNYS